MPTYQYKCRECDADLEVVQKFSDEPLTICPQCQGELRKVYSAVGVVFKGSGFYATDSRTKSKSNAATPTPAATDDAKPAVTVSSSSNTTPDSSSENSSSSDAPATTSPDISSNKASTSDTK